MLVYQHSYRDGRLQRWYSNECEAQSVLDAHAVETRGVYTIKHPLQTSPSVWRVDTTRLPAGIKPAG